MSGPAPKYSLIAERILRDVRDGRYAVGDFLPTEAALMASFEVSRHTIRHAIQDLKRRGIVASRQGQGSRIESDGRAGTFVEKVQSIDELIAFAERTERRVLSIRPVVADAVLSEQLGCAGGRRLVEIVCLREARGGAAADLQPIALITIWLDALYEDAAPLIDQNSSSAAMIVAERYGFTVGSVTQVVTADRLDAAAADRLGAAPDSPALVIQRTYNEQRTGTMFMVARSICPADRFRIVSRLVAA